MALDLMSMFAKLGLDDSEYKKGMKDAESGFKNFGSNLKKGVQNVAKIAAGAAAAGATALGGLTVALTKSAVNAYGEYEQLVGGVDTLFKGSSKRVQEYAANAYKTAGMSANQYMETVTGFSAALIQSMGGDTKAAADLADQAIRDMSDNANKMGTDISMIQNAYQGFAKGNYTMLDNLKLGYGGTKEEMDRLIRDAMKLDSSFQANTKTVIKNKKQVKELDYNYADVVRAINIVQTKMGITGATAAEAADTIQGSIAATKAAWENVLTSIGTGKGMKDATKNLVASAGNVIKNVKPVVKRALSGIGNLIAGLAPVIVKEAPGLIFSVVPSFIRSVGTAARGVMKALPKAIAEGWNTVKNVLMTNGVQKIALFLNQLITGGADKSFGPAQQRIQFRLTKLFDNVFKLGRGIADKAAQLWTDTLQPMLQSLVAFLVDRVLPVVNNVITFITDNLDTIVPIVGGIIAAIAGFAIAKKVSYFAGVVKGLFDVIKAHPFGLIITAIGAVVGWVIHLYQTNEEARDKIDAAFTAIKGFWTDTLKPAFEDMYTYVVETLIPALIKWWDTKLKPTIQTVFEAIAGFWNDTLKPAFEAIYTYVVTDLIPTLIVWWEYHLKPAIEGVFTAIKGFWDETLKPTFEAIYSYVVETLIPTLIEWWDTKLKPTIEAVFTAIKTFWEETAQPALQAFWSFVTDTLVPAVQGIGDKVKYVWDVYLRPIAAWLGETFVKAWEGVSTFATDTLVPAMQGIGDKIKYVWDTFLRPVAAWVTNTFVKVWEGLQTALDGLSKFVSGVFAGDWQTAWEGLVQLVKAPFDTLGEILKTPINAVIGLLNSMIKKVQSAINKVINGINKKLNIDLTWNIPDWMGGGQLGWQWNPNLKTVNWKEIPLLARGGIVGNGGEAIVGEYRPEHLRVVNGKAVVTPLNTGRFPGGGGAGQEVVVPRNESRQLTVILELDRQQMGKMVYKLNNEETQRVGVKLANGGAY